MNAQQIMFNKNHIKACKEEISKIEIELQNPRIRKVESRRQAIENMKEQINHALGLLFEAGVIEL